MTIRETVKRALTHMPGNKLFAICDFVLWSDAPNASALLDYTPDQIKRALRDITYVKRVHGRYIIKGRRVPPKVDITTSGN